MGYEESLRNVNLVSVLDMVFSLLPITFYTAFTFLFGFMVIIGYFNEGNDFLDWILANTMSIETPAVDFENPGQAADIRNFRCAVWGIAILFNLVELVMAYLLRDAIRKSKTEQPFFGYMAVKCMIIFVMFVLIIALLSTGSSFVGVLVSIFYLIYRGVSVVLVFQHAKNIRDMGGVP